KKMQLGGILVSPRVHDAADNVFVRPGRINSTWGGSLVDMVRCTRILEIVESERLVDNAAQRGRELVAGLETIARRFEGFVTNARGAGLMCAIDFPDPSVRDAVIRHAVAERMIVLKSGKRAVRFRPSLNVSSADVAEGIRRLELAVTRALA